MLPVRLIRYRVPLLIGLHVVLVPLGYWGAFALRFDMVVSASYRNVFLFTVLPLFAVRMIAFGLFRMYSGWWRHVGMRDMVDLVKAVTVSSVLFAGYLFATGYLAEFPRSILLLDWLLAVMIFGGARLAVRVLREEQFLPGNLPQHRTRALVIGAGEAAERLIRQLRRERGASLEPVALVDDDPVKRGMRIHGVPVIGTSSELPGAVARCKAGLVVIAIPSASRDDMQRIVDLCIASGVEFKIVPPLQELLEGRARVNQLRSVQIEDLLGRESVQLDLAQVAAELEGRVVLVTGAAGSIGSELARQIADLRPARLVLLDQAESPLYFTHMEITKRHPRLSIAPVICDVADQRRVEQVFSSVRPDFVFHAAAYKHVPLMEQNVVEAVRTNVLGTLFVAQCASQCGCQRFVLISTDKAVKPSSVMGASKRIAERLVLGWLPLRASGTDFRAVRFGNVLGSNGSVIPVFKQQIAEGGPITITDPEVTRYFMTIPEAVQLVLQASALREATDRICMLEMGEPVRIVDLAENLVRLSGLEPYQDIPFVFTGLRPGEKVHEELMSEVEATVPTSVEKIRVVQPHGGDEHTVGKGLERLTAMASLGNTTDIIVAMCELVPECVSPLREQWVRSVARRGTGRAVTHQD